METLERRVLLSATPTSLTISASANSPVYGQAVNLTADISASPSAPSEGNVAFFDNGNLWAIEPVTSGAATLDNVYWPVGAHFVTATYSDTSGNFASSSTTIGPNSIITGAAGTGFYGFSGDGGQATAAEFEDPTGVAVDSSGNLFIADSSNNLVRKVDLATGIVTTVAGHAMAGFSGDGGPATAAELDDPEGVAVDSSGHLFIADTNNHRIREVDLATGIITTAAGNGSFGFSGDGGQASAAQLDKPTSIAVDSSGHLFIADDFNQRIREVDLSTGVITTVVGNGTAGFSGDSGQATAAQLNDPYGVAVDSGNLFIGDSDNNRVREVNLATGVITTVAGNGTAGSAGDSGQAATAELNTPAGVVVNSSGDLFIADSNNARVRKVDLATGIITTVAGNGSFGKTGDGGAATAAELEKPTGVAFDPSGDLFIADFVNNRVREVESGGALVDVTPAPLSVTASGTQVYGGRPTFTPAYSGFVLNQNQGVLGGTLAFSTTTSSSSDVGTYHNAVTPSGLTSNNYAITFARGDMVVTPAPLTVTASGTQVYGGTPTFAATYGGFVLGQDTSVLGGTLAFSTTTTSASPVGIYPNAVAPSGLTSSNYSITFATGAMVVMQAPPTTGPAAPVSATGATLNGTVNPGGAMATAYFQYSTSSTFTPTVETTVGSGFNQPLGVAVDAAGDVFVADSYHSAAKEVLPNGTTKTIGSGFGFPAALAVDAFGDVFIADSGKNDVTEVLPDGSIRTIGSGFFDPNGVAVDAAGDVFVADTNHNAVKEVLPGGTIETIGSGFIAPSGVAVDSSGDVFVADWGNSAVKEVLAGSGAIQTVGSGFSDPVGVAVDAAGDVFVADEDHEAVEEVLPNGTISTIGSGFSQPSGVAVDAAGDVFVADHRNNRVVELSPPSIAATPSPLNGSTATVVSGALVGLTPGTTYYYRTVASSAGGIVADTTNPPQSFTTLTPPTVATTAASSISAGGATLNGSVNPEGATVGVSFQYSTDPNFTPTIESTVASDFLSPTGVAVDTAGDVFVADTSNNAVKEVLPDGSIRTIGSGFSNPSGVAVDASGDVFVGDTDNNAVKEVMPDGSIRTIGSGFFDPDGVAVDAAGDVFVADTAHNAVKEVLPDGTINTIGSGFSNPHFVAVDASGDVFVTDLDNEIKEVLRDGNILTIGSGFSLPDGIAVNASGDLFVADYNNETVEEVLSDGTVQTLGTAFNNPSGVAVDASGDVFVADRSNNRVVELSPPSVLATPSPVSGSTATGVSGTLVGLTPNKTYFYRVVASVVGGTVAEAISSPASFKTLLPTAATAPASSVSATGATLNGTLFPNGATAAATFQYSISPTFTPTVESTIGSGFANPTGLAVDTAGDVFVADTSNTAVKEVLPDGSIETIGSGFHFPHDVAVDAAGDVFVADTGVLGVGNGAVKEVRPDGSIQTIGSGFVSPLGVAVDASGDVFVADIGNNAVKEVLPNGSIRTIGSGLNRPYAVAVDASGDLFVTDAGAFSVDEVLPNGTIQTLATGINPSGVAVDASGDVFVDDEANNAVREVRPDGSIQTIGSGFSQPFGVAVSMAGDVFVGDSGNNRVVELSPPAVAAVPSPVSGATATAVSATLLGLTRGTTYYYRLEASSAGGAQADTQSKSFTTLTPPTVATAAATSISTIGATLGGRVNPEGSTTAVYFQYSTDPTFTPSVETRIGSAFSQPYGVAVDASGDVFVADKGGNAVQEVLGDGGIQTIGSGFNSPTGVAADAAGDVFVADGLNGAVKKVLPNGDIETLGSGFSDPVGVAVDATGDVFVADYHNTAIQEVLPNGIIQTIGSGFLNPFGVAVDASGDVFVADTGNHLVKEILPGGSIATLGSGFSAPVGVAVDASGDVFVADYLNRAVTEILPGGGSKTLGSAFGAPAGVAVDAAGDVFVADSGNHRVVELSPPTAAATPSLSGSTSIAVSASATGLAPGTIYYYRAVAVSAGGTVVDATSPPASFTTPAITWATPADITYGTALGKAQLDATASSGGLTLPGTFTYTLADGTTPAAGALLSAGQNQVLIATFTPADSTDYATDTAQVEINVNPAPLTVTASGTQVFGGTPTFTASYNGFVLGQTSSVLGGTLAFTTTTSSNSPVGTYPNAVIPSGLTSSNYAITFVPGEMVVTPATAVTPIITWPNPGDITYGTAISPAQLNATANVPGTFSYTLADGKTPAAGAVLHAGQNQVLNVTFTPTDLIAYTTAASHVEVNVDPAVLTISADGKSKVYGAALPTLTASYSGFVHGDSAASLTTRPSLSTTATAASHVSANPYTITASGAVDADYTVTYVPGSLTVTPAPLTITADNKSKVYGAALPTLSASYSGFVNGDGAASLTPPPTLSTTATASSHVSGNPYAITASGAVDADYTITYVPGTLTVTPAPLTITADNKSKVYGAAVPTLSASYSGFVNGDDAASLMPPPTLSTTATAGSHVAGSPYSITASGAIDSDYTIAYVPGSLTVTPSPLTITADNKSKLYGAALPALTASYSGFVNGDGAADLSTQPSLSTIATAGSHVVDSPYAIIASGASDADYTISYATGALTVTPAPLTITADDKSKIFGAPLPTLTASYSGFVNGDTATNLTPPPTLATTATPSSRVSGSPYAITASGAADADYTISYVPGKLTVVAAPFDASGVSVAAAEGATFSATTANFSDTGSGPYVATIDWGDNTPLATVTPTPIAGGSFGVSGNHLYAEEGSYTLSVIIRDAAGASVTVHPLASVADAPLTGATATIAAGATVTGTVASFIDADTGDAAGDYAASIDWGDGQTSAGTIVAGTSAGAFNVAGNHSYTDNNPHTVTVAVTHGTEQPLVIKSVEPGQTINLLGNFGVAEDIYVVGPGTVTVAAANGLLANDSASGPLTVTSGTVAGANGGTFVFHIDGSFTYTPPANFPGFDHAQYTATDAAGDHASATVNVLSQTGGVVWKFYESVLGRDPDYAGLQHWITDFANGGKTGDIAVGFFESDELLDKIIGGYYEQYLQRAADSGGLAHWKAVWDQNGGPEQIRVFFAESDEFYASSGGTPDAWINALYQRILSRAPDAHGEQFWLSYYQQQIAAGVEPEAVRYYIASFFLTSKEDFADDVTGWFNEYLLRAPTDGELQQYTAEMLAGASDRQIEQEITNLPEYGQNPPASPAGTAQRLPDYFQSGSRPSSQQATVAAKDAVFSQLGN